MNHITLKGIKRKALTVIGRTIPYNQHYRPKGIYRTSKDYFKAISDKEPASQYIEIYPNLVSELNITEAFYNSISDVYKPNWKVETTYLVTAIEKGRIFTDHISTIAVISQDNNLIADVSLSYDKGKVVRPEENAIFSQKFFKEPVKYEGVVFSMLSGLGAVHNYAHWLIDSLPRIHLLKESGLFDKVDWFLVPNYVFDFQKDSLKMLGIDENKIIRGDQQLHIQADVLIASTAPRGNEQIMPSWCGDFLRNTYLKEEMQSNTYPPLVYISRRDSKIRNVTNEDQVVDLLKQYGFKTFTLSSLPFTEKIKLFASAQVIVSAAGAGMANLVFCKEGTKVLEVFTKGFVHMESYDKANRAGLEYHYIIGKHGKDKKNPQYGQHQHMTIDLAVLKQMIENITQRQETAYENAYSVK